MREGPTLQLPPGVAVTGKVRAGYDAVLTPAALAFVATVDVAHFENHLEKLGEGRTPVASRHQEPLERPALSTDRLELLRLLLRKRKN